MSISKLNDQLKADICSFLDFKDINKLAQVNKGIKASLQRRGLDKPKIHSLFFEGQWDSDKLHCSVQVHSKSGMSHKEIKLDKDFATTNSINKFKTIEDLVLYNVLLQDNAGWEDFVAKIGSVELDHCDIKMSKETVMKFFKKFELVRLLDGCDMDPSYITDEFFVELARNGTTVDCWNYPLGNNYGHVVAVTDATLDSISRVTVSEQLILKGLITGITFARVKKMIEDVLKTRTQVRYDFGYLKSDQFDEAHRFMSEEFEGWMESLGPYRNVDVDNYGYFEDYTLSEEDLSFQCIAEAFYIKFGVCKWEELPQNDNDGEEESGDEAN